MTPSGGLRFLYFEKVSGAERQRQAQDKGNDGLKPSFEACASS